jgi:hypothetical protein
MTRRHALVWFGIIAALLSAERQAHAQPLTPGNLLVSNLGAGTLSEYTSAGVFVRSFAFPDFEGGFHDLRDIAVSSNGNVQAFNGTFTPQLTTLVPTGPTFTSQPFTGWSTINNISYGGIGNFGSATFVTDMATASPGGPQGIVRFGNGGSPVRFASTNDYQDLTVGGDGLIYALRGGAPSFNVDVFDPNTLGLVRSIPLDASLVSADVRGLAVSSAGSMFAAAWNGTVYAMNSSGTITNSRVTGFSNLTDIDLDNADRYNAVESNVVYAVRRSDSARGLHFAAEHSGTDKLGARRHWGGRVCRVEAQDSEAIGRELISDRCSWSPSASQNPNCRLASCASADCPRAGLSGRDPTGRQYRPRSRRPE